ncbi:putative adenylylsulfatase [Rosa chinensis]|uniref:Putative adenylylsulfatase n=1 Tax=Rosa chinensis TaxID=74649 RepID=A0A2P6R8X8_ROSCH|nr:putative adenylylsulfatase [Rosa chinensis]
MCSMKYLTEFEPIISGVIVDTIKNGKAGTKAQCIESARSALREGKSVFIDRCNLEKEQRDEFVKLVGPQVDVHTVMLDLPAKLCISRLVKRTGHEGNLQGRKAAAVVNRMLQKKELPNLSEGFGRITFCQNESDVESAICSFVHIVDSFRWIHFPMALLARRALVQKFNLDSNAFQIIGGKDTSLKGTGLFTESCSMESKKGERPVVGSAGTDDSLDNAPTLAFPSISTADFQYDIKKASDIIVEKVVKFVNKLGNARLFLVDLTHKSKILSLIKLHRKTLTPTGSSHL